MGKLTCPLSLATFRKQVLSLRQEEGEEEEEAPLLHNVYEGLCRGRHRAATVATPAALREALVHVAAAGCWSFLLWLPL